MPRKINVSNKQQLLTANIPQKNGRPIFVGTKYFSTTIKCPHCGFLNPYLNTIVCEKCGKPLGRKYDEDKTDWSLFPWEAGAAIVRIMMFGAKKYARGNWKHIDNGVRYISAAIRHIAAWLGGEAKDSETGYSHLWHAGCCLVFAIWLEIKGKLTNDRLDEPI